MFAAKPQYAREVIHAFNDKGFAALDPEWSGGRPRKFGPHVHEIICPGRSYPTAAGRAVVHHLEPVEARRAPRQDPPGRGQHRDRPAGPAWGRGGLAGHQDLEGQQGPPLRREDGPHPRTSTTAPPPDSSARAR
ncbi:MAG: hypothetical protein AB7V44_34250 [Pseudonocardia sp.]